MDTDRLQYFCTIVELGTLTQAAEMLNISHSALSKSMGVLEDELGVTLFRPHGRGLQVTSEGHEVYRRAKEVLESINELKRRAPASPTRVRIGLPETLSLALGHRLAHLFPDNLELLDLHASEIETHLLAGKIEFGFTFVPFPKSQVEYLKVVSVKMHSYALKKIFDQLPHHEIPYVVPSSELLENPLSFKNRDGWNPELSRYSKYHVNSLSTALNLVREGLAAVYIPDYLAAEINSHSPADQRIDRLKQPSQWLTQEETVRTIYLTKMQAETADMKRACKELRLLVRN